MEYMPSISISIIIYISMCSIAFAQFSEIPVVFQLQCLGRNKVEHKTCSAGGANCCAELLLIYMRCIFFTY